jgi:hypothetical protein
MLCEEVANMVLTAVGAITAVDLDECFFYSDGGRNSAASYCIAYHHSMQQHPTEEAEASIPTETVSTHRNDANNAAPTIKDRWRVTEAGKAVAATDAAGTA